MLTPPSVAQLAEFTGRPEASYGPYATQALAQATLLFSVTTKLVAYPDDPLMAQLARNAILELADRIFLEQPYAADKATPYQSETIGSYTYSKGSAANAAKNGARTGLYWWDLALDELTAMDRSLAGHGSLSALERDDIVYDDAGSAAVCGPADRDRETGIGFTNTELSPRPRLG